MTAVRPSIGAGSDYGSGMTTEADRAASPIEANLLALFERMQPRLLKTERRGDVLVYTSESSFPLFNGVAPCRLSCDVVEQRAGAVVDEMVGRGKPFIWWTTDSTRTPELVSVLEARGLVATGQSPGMSLDLTVRRDLDDPEPVGTVTVSRPGRDDVEEMTDVFMQVFGLPPDARPYAVDFNTSLPEGPEQSLAQVVAHVDGAPAGCGLVMMVNGVAGLYNIGVLDSARRRGVGSAVTRELLRIGRENGCHTAALYASELGLSVYEKAGFVAEGTAVNFAWLG